ncbi:MAG: hypothetical protein EA412_11365 [Chitinophagaceae bacterium]|nr:MAG: hypothetical protein EA412_11365 [Chitinophagaceae bacterium]
MRKQLYIILFTCYTFVIYGQNIDAVMYDESCDSSFYSVIKVNENEYWAGGKHGILKRIDTFGNYENIDFPNSGLNILKMVNSGDYVFMATNRGAIYRIDTRDNSFISKTFSGFGNKCFYDMIVLESGDILVSGGTSGISRGRKRLPRGFIAKVDPNLESIQVKWKNRSHFVWSILQKDDGSLIAATFNGVNSHILKTTDFKEWNRLDRVRGLIYVVNDIDGLIYGGAPNFRYNRNGIAGRINQNTEMFEETGCLWTMQSINGKIISTTQSGDVIMINRKTNETERFQIPEKLSLYSIAIMNESKFMTVGHGKSIYIIDLDQTPLQTAF